MDLSPTLVNGLVVVAVGILLNFTRTQLRDLRESMSELKADIREVKQDVRSLRTDMNDGFGRLDARLTTEIGSVRSDLTQVALAVGAGQRPQTG